MPALYPRWAYFPRNERVPAWVYDLTAAVAGHQGTISTVDGSRLDSNGVLLELADDLALLGYQVE